MDTQQIRDIVRILRANPRSSVFRVVSQIEAAKPLIREIHAIVMPIGDPLRIGGPTTNQVFSILSKKIPNSGLKVSPDILVFFLNDNQYRRAKLMARRKGVALTALGEALMEEMR